LGHVKFYLFWREKQVQFLGTNPPAKIEWVLAGCFPIQYNTMSNPMETIQKNFFLFRKSMDKKIKEEEYLKKDRR
jgi:hypothetical protein